MLPIRVTEPFSTAGSRASCWLLLNLCISSIKRIVFFLFSKFFSAFFIASLISETFESTALSFIYSLLVFLAIIDATVDLPTPIFIYHFP